MRAHHFCTMHDEQMCTIEAVWCQIEMSDAKWNTLPLGILLISSHCHVFLSLYLYPSSLPLYLPSLYLALFFHFSLMHRHFSWPISVVRLFFLYIILLHAIVFSCRPHKIQNKNHTRKKKYKNHNTQNPNHHSENGIY